jgi:hypothetical protein
MDLGLVVVPVVVRVVVRTRRVTSVFPWAGAKLNFALKEFCEVRGQACNSALDHSDG